MVFEVSACKERSRQVEKESVVRLFKPARPQEPGEKGGEPFPEADWEKDTEGDRRQCATQNRR